MVNLTFAFVIFGICLAGSSYTSWRLGKQAGAEDTLEFLVDQGIIQIEYDEEDEQ